MVYEGFAQKVDTVPDMICLQELGGDTVCQESLKLLKQQGLLSDCEFGIKNANADFNKQDYIYYSEELVGSNLYCNVLERDYCIKWRFYSDLFSVEYYRCYNKEMSRLLIQKYGFNIFKKSAEKVNSFSEIKPASDSCYEYSCIPDFIQKKEKVYIHDPYVKDTLIVRFRVEVKFNDMLLNELPKTIVKSVHLIDLDIRSENSRNRKILSSVIPMNSPYDKYLWDLCSAKIMYWFMYQHYNLSLGKMKYENNLYMTAVLYLVPEEYKFCQ